MEEVCSTCSINHLCPVKHGYSWNVTTRQEAKELEKKTKINSKCHWVRSKGDNLRSDFVNWDDIIKEVVVRKSKDLRTHQVQPNSQSCFFISNGVCSI